MKNKPAAELRNRYETRVRDAADKKNQIIRQAKLDFDAAVKAARREIYGKVA